MSEPYGASPDAPPPRRRGGEEADGTPDDDTAARGASGDGAVSGAPVDDGAHELCLWLAAQAAVDRGLVGRLVRTHGSFAQVMALPRWSLALAVRKPAGADDSSPPDGVEPEAPQARASGDEAVVTWADADYPPGLRELFDPPPALFVRGRHWREMLRALRERPTVAIVGARHPSPYGLEMAWLLGSGLARVGVNVVSGMALGIDAQAHVGALDGLGRGRGDVSSPAAPGRGDIPSPAAPGRGHTDLASPGGLPVALAGVLGSGARLNVPRSNSRLFADVARYGVLLSEYGWLLPPVPWRFPARNRLIAALADAVVIVEGRATSGALHTAAFALDLGRDVLAVPGEAGRPLSAGPHRLLRDGAHLCESPDDVIALLPGSTLTAAARASNDVDPSEGTGHAAAAGALPAGPRGRVLAALRRGQHTADQLERSLGLAPQHVAAALAMLEIDGLLDVLPGGRYRLRRRPRPPGAS